MLGRWALILTVVAVCISTAGCQRRGEKRKKGKEWRDFGRDWGILMKHIFSQDTEEADILSQIKCCKSSDTAQDQSHAVCRCVKRAHFKQSEYKQLKMAVGTRKRDKTHGEDEEAEMLQMLRRGNVAMLPLLRKVTALMVVSLCNSNECITSAVPSTGSNVPHCPLAYQLLSYFCSKMGCLVKITRDLETTSGCTDGQS